MKKGEGVFKPWKHRDLGNSRQNQTVLICKPCNKKIDKVGESDYRIRTVKKYIKYLEQERNKKQLDNEILILKQVLDQTEGLVASSAMPNLLRIIFTKTNGLKRLV